MINCTKGIYLKIELYLFVYLFIIIIGTYCKHTFYRRVIKIRVFIAIDFDKDTKSYFEDIKSKLEAYCIKGRFTHIENFHLTLQFIGELEQNNILRLLSAMQECISKLDSFSLTVDKLGSFKKGNSNLLWLGIKNSNNLVGVYEKLGLALKHEKIPFDEKPLKPHITLGRQIILKKELNELIELLTVDNIVIPVNNITLMESTHVNGKLTYTPIAMFPLNH
jgi:2'-5' RNA ligase